MTSKNIISFLLAHPYFALSMLSVYYPFTLAQLKKYSPILRWNSVSKNRNIAWSEDILCTFANYLNWYELSVNPNVFTNVALIETFSHRIDWKGDEACTLDTIANNAGVPWCEELIERHKSRINLKKLSCNNAISWNEALVDRYMGQWSMQELACNHSFPWTLRRFEKYLDESYIDFPALFNPKITGDWRIVERYRHRVEWWQVFANPELPWKEKNLFEYWKDKADWYGISLNEYFFRNDPNFFYKHINKWKLNNYLGFKGLSSNIALPWSLEFIDRYVDLWYWTDLCMNESIPWSIDLLEYFFSYIKWGGWHDGPLFNPDGELIASTGGPSLELGLTMNYAVPWSLSILKEFELQLDLKDLSTNDAVWEKAFKPFVDDDVIDLVFRII